MDRFRHLALAEHHIVDGEGRLARQQKVIAELDRDGRDTKTTRMVWPRCKLSNSLL